MTLSSPPSPSYDTVLQVVESWPPADQIAFAETILQRAHQRVHTTPPTPFEAPVTARPADAPASSTPARTPTSMPDRDAAPTSTLPASQSPRPPQRPSWRDLVGAATLPGHEPPSDAQVAQWLDERREERYGG